MSKLVKLPIPYEPKRLNRWMVTLPTEIGVGEWSIHKTSRPTIYFDEKNNPKYSPIDIYFYDPIGPSTSQQLFLLTEAYKYKKPSFFKRIINKITGVDSKPNYMYEHLMPYVNGFDYHLTLLGPIGDAVEKWLIKGCKIISIDFDDLCYSDNEPIIVKMTVQPKSFTLLY